MNRIRGFQMGAATVVALFAAACGSDGAGAQGGGGGGSGGAGGGSGGGGGTPSGEFVPLITADWSLSPGEEGYVCATKTLTETLYVGAIRPISPPGTHHTVVDLIAASGPDDPGSPCGPTFGSFFAGGIGTGDLVLPAGVGLVAPAGQQVFLNLHVYNVGTDVLSRTSGVEVQLLDPSEVQHEASIKFYGPFGFEIPPGGEHSLTDQATFLGAQTLIAIFPHMHRLGSHFKVDVVRDGAHTTIWDDDFQFDSQEFSLIEPMTVQPGDVLETTCTWTNTTGSPVYYGDSSDSEMCFTTLMSY